MVTVFTSDGQPVQQSRTTKSLYDRTQEVVTTSFTGAPPSITRITFDNDRRVLRSVIIDAASGSLIWSCYSADGTLLMRSHSRQTATERICQQEIISGGKARTTVRREQLQLFDERGNWTQLTIFEGDDCVARIHRIIAYYPAN